MDLDGAMAEFVESRAIPIFGIANVQGFADALPGWHPSVGIDLIKEGQNGAKVWLLHYLTYG